MSKPYDLYIRYLFTAGVDDVRDVNKRLEELGIGEVTQEDYERVATQACTNLPSSIITQIEKKKYGKHFMKWMRYLKVDGFWNYDKDPQKASAINQTMDIHSDRIYRLSANALLVKRVTTNEVQQVLAAKFSASYKEEHIILYKNFFFDPDRMSRRDWISFLGDRNNYEKHIYFMALTEDVDVLKAELGLYANVAVSEELSKLLRKSLNKANSYLKVSTKEADVEARAWIATSAQLIDKYEKYRSGDSTDFSKNLQMEFEYIDHEFPTPDNDTLDQLNQRLKAKETKEKADASEKQEG